MGGEKCLLYDIGPSGAMAVILGAPECVRALGRSHVWGADGAFKKSLRLRAHVYTSSAHCSGFAIPCLRAIHPEKTAETYASMWAAIRANIGQEAADVDMLVSMDIENGASGAESESSHVVRFEGFYFHLGGSAYRQVQKLGLLR